MTYEDLIDETYEGRLKKLLEKYDGDSRDLVIEEVIKPNLEIGSSVIYLFNEFCIENSYDFDYFYTDINEAFKGLKPIEIARKVTQCNFDYNKPYHKIGIYSVSSYSLREAKDEILEDNNFLNWYLDKYSEYNEKDFELEEDD